MNLWKLILLFVIGGCSRNFPMIPNQGEAESIVWCATFHDHNVVPPVEWIKPPGLDCASNTGFTNEGICVAGVYHAYQDYIEVALSSDEKISATAYAHELYHAHLGYTTGDPDGYHLNPGFGVDFGFPFGIVDVANQNLIDVGL